MKKRNGRITSSGGWECGVYVLQVQNRPQFCNVTSSYIGKGLRCIQQELLKYRRSLGWQEIAGNVPIGRKATFDGLTISFVSFCFIQAMVQCFGTYILFKVLIDGYGISFLTRPARFSIFSQSITFQVQAFCRWTCQAWEVLLGVRVSW